MEFKDLNLTSGVKALNDYMVGRSYITGVEPTQNDLIVFRAISADFSKEKTLTNVKRWYMHIKSFSNDEIKAFPTAKEKIKVVLPQTCEVNMICRLNLLSLLEFMIFFVLILVINLFYGNCTFNYMILFLTCKKGCDQIRDVHGSWIKSC